jgi:hypothetical protein
MSSIRRSKAWYVSISDTRTEEGYMIRTSRTVRRGALVLAAALATVATSPLPASAAVDVDTVPLTISSFDPAVAAAHGYRVETGADGKEMSVPVTDAARDEQRRSGAARNTVSGNCGSATLTITRNRARQGINIQTSYVVKGASLGHHWGVTGATGVGKLFTEPFSGLASGSRWSATHFKSVYGWSSGFGQIDVGSFATLSNGAICHAGRATSSW